MGVSSQGQLNGGFPYVCVMEPPGCDHELDGICQVGHFLLCVHRPIRSHTEIGVAADKAHLPVTLAILKLHCRHREEKGKGDTELENSIVRFTPWGICKSLTHLAGLRLTRIHQDVSWNISSPLLSPLIPCFDVFGKTNCLSVPEPKYTGGEEGLNSFPYHSFPQTRRWQCQNSISLGFSWESMKRRSKTHQADWADCTPYFAAKLMEPSLEWILEGCAAWLRQKKGLSRLNMHTHTRCFKGKVPCVWAGGFWYRGGVWSLSTSHMSKELGQMKHRNRQGEMVLDCWVLQRRFSRDGWHESAIIPHKTQEESTVSDSTIWKILSFHCQI